MKDFRPTLVTRRLHNFAAVCSPFCRSMSEIANYDTCVREHDRGTRTEAEGHSLQSDSSPGPTAREDSSKTCGQVAGFGTEVRLLGCKKKFQEEETTMKSMFSIYQLCSRTVGYAALLLLSIPVFGQDSVILKRMGPGDQITSHMYSFGIRGKQFQFVQGEMPKGVQWHGRLTDNDVRKLQDAGAKIVIQEPNSLKCFPRSRCCFPHCSLTSAAVAGTSSARAEKPDSHSRDSQRALEFCDVKQAIPMQVNPISLVTVKGASKTGQTPAESHG